MADETVRQIEPFEFKECAIISKATGRRAKSLRDFRDLMVDASENSLYYHVYQYFLKQHMSEYSNDFADWAGEALEERALAEQLSNVDPFDFKDMAGIRKEFLTVIDSYLDQFPEPREVLPGQEFYFEEAVTVTFDVGIKAQNLAEFLVGIKYVDDASIYYHFYEARLRQGTDDFSHWLGDFMGEEELAGKVRAIDPFMHSFEEVREHIVTWTEQEVRRNMEGVS